LRLGDNPFGDEGAAALADSPHLEKLCLLDVDRCGLTEQGKRALRQRFGDRVWL
jgi:hypothetical protein